MVEYAPMHTRHASILLVEDSSDEAELTKMALTRHGLGARVIHVPNGLDALDYLHRRGPYSGRTDGNPALVLLDLKMPQLDGFGVLEEIKRAPHLKHLPVVVLTSSTEPSDLRRAYEAGTNAYVAKPTDFAEFLGAMKVVCEFWLRVNHTHSGPGF